jgi:hypothetical protein
LPTQNDWNEDKLVNILPPIQDENFLYIGKGKDINFSFALGGII